MTDPSQADFSQVSGLFLISQSGGYVTGGGEGFRLTSISAVPEASPAAMMAAGLGVIALLGAKTRRR